MKLGQKRKLYKRIDIKSLFFWIYNNLYIIYYVTIKLIINFVCYFKIYYAELIMQEKELYTLNWNAIYIFNKQN